MTEEQRRVTLWVLAVAGWLYAIAAATWDTVDDHSPAILRLTVILSMGVAIATGAALGRMQSVKTLTQVFNAGMLVHRSDDHEDKGDDQ